MVDLFYFTSGSFSCPFNREPLRQDVEAHLLSHGFHVVATEAKENVLQVYFHAYQMGTDVYFLGEFVFLFSRRFFQATFKCKVCTVQSAWVAMCSGFCYMHFRLTILSRPQDHDIAPEFVTRFNLQELQVLEQ